MITKEGLKLMELFHKYGLVEYYQPEMGNVSINKNELTSELQEKIFKFMSENVNDFVMGFEGYEEDETYLYIVKKEDLF